MGRRMVILIIILLTLIVVFLGRFDPSAMSFREDLALNLLAEIFGVGLTIILIDAVLRKNKEKQYQEINRIMSKMITLSINQLMFTILKKCDLITDEKEFYGDKTDFSPAVELFLKEETQVKILDFVATQIPVLNIESFEKVKGLTDEMIEAGTAIAKSLEKNIKPYPSPVAMAVFAETIPYMTGSISAFNELKKGYLTEIKEKIKDKETFEPGFKVLLELGPRDKANSYLHKALSGLVEVQKLSKENKLAVILD